jgi:hypothetical protein
LKKRSAASSKLPEPVTFFLDRSLGSLKVAKALRDVHQSVVIHDDVFPQDAQDTTWLPEVGRRGWVVLTKDRHIRTRRNEVAELMAAGLAVFVITKADMSGNAQNGGKEASPFCRPGQRWRGARDARSAGKGDTVTEQT